MTKCSQFDKKVNDMSNKIELMKAEIETLVSMTEEEAEEQIISGFLK